MSIPHPASARVVGAIEFTSLYLPGRHPEFMTFTIAGGQKLFAGSVLGQITASGKLTLAKAAAGDGSQVGQFVLQEDLYTFAQDGVTAQDQSMAVIVRGYLNAAALVIDPSLKLADVRTSLRQAGILTDIPGYSG